MIKFPHGHFNVEYKNTFDYEYTIVDFLREVIMKKLKFICSFLLILIFGTSCMLSAKDTESKIEDITFNESDFEVMKDAGFDSIRIPVAWTSTMDWSNVDFKINDDFMDRLKPL